MSFHVSPQNTLSEANLHHDVLSKTTIFKRNATLSAYSFFFVVDLTRYAETTYANNIHFILAIHAFHGIKFTFL